MSTLDKISELSKAELIQLTLKLVDEVASMRPEERLNKVAPIDSLSYELNWTEAACESSDLLRRDQVLYVSAEKNLIELEVDTFICLKQFSETEAVEVLNYLDDNHVIKEIVFVCDCSSESQMLDSCKFLLFFLKRILSYSRSLRFSLVTQNAQCINSDSTVNIYSAAVVGMLKAFNLEHPAYTGLCIDFDRLESGFSSFVVNELSSTVLRDEVVFRKGKRFTSKLESVSLDIAKNDSIKICSDSTYLVSGGIGGVGSKIAEFLVAQGAKCLVLTGRNDEQYYQSNNQYKDRISQVNKWRNQGVKVLVEKVDVTDKSQVNRLFEEVLQDLPALKGVFHLSGINKLIPFAELTVESFEEIFSVKVKEALYFREFLSHAGLDFDVYFSSIAGVWGSGGMAPYCAASRFINCLPVLNAKSNCLLSSISWGPWGKVGMISDQGLSAFALLGLRFIDYKDAISLIKRIFKSRKTNPIILDVDWNKYVSSIGNKKCAELFAGLCNRVVEKNILEPRRNDYSIDQISQAVKNIIASLLGCDVNNVSSESPLHEMGVTSLMSIALKDKVELLFGIKFSSTIIFDFPTINKLAEEIFSLLNFSNKKTKHIDTAKEQDKDAAIAVIGMGCQFPDADSPNVLWSNLLSGLQSINDLSSERYSLDFCSSKFNKKEIGGEFSAGYLQAIDQFDYSTFKLSRAEAKFMDPQQRFVLETSWRALEDAGYDPLSLEGQHVGVYVGVGQNEYGPLCRSKINDESIEFMTTGQSMNVIAGRVSYTFGLTGPSIVYDTACSSSLVALHEAAKGLRQGDCNMAIVGGVNILVAPETFVLLSESNMLSRTGHPLAFDQRADGYVRGEGCGVIILKRYKEAVRDGDYIYCVLKGSAVNHDGRSSSLTAPAGKSQEAVIKQALNAASITPDMVQFIEAHGTSTPLGDPIEYRAIQAAYGTARRDRPVYLSSIKNNIGHTEAASGIAGVIKAALSIERKCLAKHAGFGFLNKSIDCDPNVKISSENIDLSGQSDMIYGAVSSFGLSGTNAHVILGEADCKVSKQSLKPCSFNKKRCWYTDEPLNKSTSLFDAYESHQPGEDYNYYTVEWDEVDYRDYLQERFSNESVVIVSADDNKLSRVIARVLGKPVCTLSSMIDADSQERQALLQGKNIIYIPGKFVDHSSKEANEDDRLAGLKNGYEALKQWLEVLTDVDMGSESKFFIATHSSQSSGLKDASLDDVFASYVWGVVKSFNAEYKTKQHILIDFDSASLSESFIKEKYQQIFADRAPYLILREQKMFCRRLVKYAVLRESKGYQVIASDSTYVVTGGHGGIGPFIVDWLIRSGAKTVVVLSRSKPSSTVAKRFKMLSQQFSSEIISLQVNVANRQELFSALDGVSNQYPVIKGVFHAAGVTDDSSFKKQSWNSCLKTYLPKAMGAYYLHEYSKKLPLDYFVMFSSISSLFGSEGQANYCIANEYLDQLACMRKSHGLPGLSINWGPWESTGLLAKSSNLMLAYYKSLGVRVLPASYYMNVFKKILNLDTPQVAVYQMSESLDTDSHDDINALKKSLSGSSQPKRLYILQRKVQEIFKKHLGFDDLEDFDKEFSELGVTSLHMSIFQKQVEKLTGNSFSEDLLFEYSSINKLANHLTATVYSDLFVPAEKVKYSGLSDDELINKVNECTALKD